jgi:hypothetical protein
MADARENQYRLGVSLGYSFTGYREETYSAVNRYLNTLTFLLDGNIERRNFLHSFNAGFFMGDSHITADEVVIQKEINHQTGEASYSAFLQQFISIRGFFEYALAYRLWGNDTFPGFIGGSFRTDAYLQFANYPSITGIVSLGIHATQEWIINNENSLVLSLGFPFFGYAVRPPYAGADAALIKYAAEGNVFGILGMGEIASFHNYWAVFGELKYSHRVNNLISLTSGFGFEFSRINFPRPRADVMFRINSGISFTF